MLLAATALGLALRVYQLARPGFLLGVTEYDDGVYFGSAVRLFYGAVPYRDFVLVHPPGIVLLMAPLGLLARATGTATAFAVARVLTAVAGAACVPLGGSLVRHRGPLAVAIVCGLLAVYPAGIDASHTVLLEPWLVLFCLFGALAAFEGDRLTARSRRLTWAGVAFGFAVAIKLWAALPLLIIALLYWALVSRRAGLRCLAGVLIGFGAAALPFFVSAPGSFYRDVVVAQLSRADLTRVPVWLRLQSLAGLNVPKPASHAVIALACIALAGLALAFALGAWFETRRPPPVLDCFAGLTAILILVVFLVPADFYPHYAWFFAPFLALSLGLTASRWAAGFTVSLHGRAGRSVRARMVPLLTLAAMAVTGLFAVRQFQHLSRLRSGDPAPLVRRSTSRGACLLVDIPTVSILADRFVSTDPGCSPMVDPIGTSYALSGGRNGVTGAARTPAVMRLWRSAFEAARYVWVQCLPWRPPQCQSERRIPWTRSLLRYFTRHFELVRGQGRGMNLFVRRSS